MKPIDILVILFLLAACGVAETHNGASTAASDTVARRDLSGCLKDKFHLCGGHH